MSGTCAAIEPELSAYVDGELAPARRAEVLAHVEACAVCAHELQMLRGTSDVLRQWDAHETGYAASHGFRSRVLTAVGGKGAPVRRPPLVLHRAAAAAVVLVAAGASAALVIPALRVPDRGDTRGESLRADIDRLTVEMLRLAESKPVAVVDGVEGASPSPASAEPVLDPWTPVVAEPKGAAVHAPAPRTFQWERRGEEMSLAVGAITEFERYQMEKRFKGLEEKLAARGDAPEPGSPVATTMPPTPLAAYLARVRVADGAFSPYEAIQVWPLVVRGGGGDAPEHTPLSVEEALRQGVLVAREAASESRVQVENTDVRRDVLILAGDLLRGGRQDRVASNDVLVPAGARLTIAARTSGDEHRRKTSTFRAGGGLAPAHLRALVAANVSSTPWRDGLAETISAFASINSRGSLDQVFLNDVLMGDVERYVRQFTPRLEGDEVVGLAVTSGSTVLGAEVFGDHATFRALRARVLRSFLLEARLLQEGSVPGRDEVAGMLADAHGGAHEAWSASGNALESFRSQDGSVFGGGLLDGNRPVHAVVFKYAARGRGPGWVPREHGAGFDPAGSSPALGGGPGPASPGRGSGGTGGGGLNPGKPK